ncbi:MAG TPA: LLM class flavin-dependent oxidoreductase [Solirubrobacteraceae bacterium]|nr:LLM class flavin-dependent oxidoreductase [Solirubrobacteraceae bacterium]
MRFGLSLNLERQAPGADIKTIVREIDDLVRMADEGGFDMLFAPEHHTLEMTIGPNPFIQLAHWADITSRIRLGTAVLAVPYWHPIRLAGEAALFDVLSDGRLELGLGRGAYKYEFDRMAGGLSPEEGRDRLEHMVPLLRQLWAGDHSSDYEAWAFPTATATPKPLQQPGPPIWLAARHPSVFDLAVRTECDVMATPLSDPFDEVVSLRDRLDAACATYPDKPRPRFMVLRDACVYDRPDGWEQPVEAIKIHARQFETLFSDVGGVTNGFPDLADLEALERRANYRTADIRENLVFGRPDEVIAKLKRYEEVGVDYFLYGACWGLDHRLMHKSLGLFIREVLPAFDTQLVA